jgi:hypothetical protein
MLTLPGRANLTFAFRVDSNVKFSVRRSRRWYAIPRPLAAVVGDPIAARGAGITHAEVLTLRVAHAIEAIASDQRFL